MYVLTRRRDEKILIDRTITMTVLEIHGNRVQLGFEAPDETRIVRGEVVKVQAEAPAATSRKETV